MNQLISQYAQGNIGATMFLTLLFTNHLNVAISITSKLEQISSLKGDNLYVLFNDLCGRDYDKVAKLCQNCPNDILEEACSRQDRSGKELIAQYL